MHAAPKKRWIKVNDFERQYPKDIANTKSSCPINNTRTNNKLTNNMNNIGNTWTSNSEIYQAPNNSMI